MRKASKVTFLIAGLCLIAIGVIQLVNGTWINLNTVLLCIALALIPVAIFFDRKLYWDLLTMRTTKHGMNMGMTILLVVISLICVNYLVNRHNKSWDFTQERLNSLSDQSNGILKELKDEYEVLVFFKGNAGMEERQRLKQNMALYLEGSNKLKVRYINAYQEHGPAMTYLNDIPDRDNTPIVIFLEKKSGEGVGRKWRIDTPFEEAQITAALIKATRSGESKIYFVKGHGEKNIESVEEEGLSDLVRALTEASFSVESLSLIDKKEIPKDAAVVAVIGPSTAYLDSEIQWLREYALSGGKIFLALDPGRRHNLANLTKTFGVEFANNFVLTLAPVVGGGPETIVGPIFDAASEITKSFPSGSAFAVFPVVSELRPAPGKEESIQVSEIVKSDPYAYTTVDPRVQHKENSPTQPVTVAVTANGEMPSEKGGAQKFEAVIFGDSDFMTNRALALGINRDLALNAFAQLANQKDLISIRPKLPKGTVVVMGSMAQLGIVIAGLALPMLLLMTAGILWFRRRGA